MTSPRRHWSCLTVCQGNQQAHSYRRRIVAWWATILRSVSALRLSWHHPGRIGPGNRVPDQTGSTSLGREVQDPWQRYLDMRRCRLGASHRDSFAGASASRA